MKKTKRLYFWVIVALSVLDITSQIALAQQAKKVFTVADDIALTYFSPPGGGRVQVLFSPDGNYFAVWSERGRLDLNCVEDSLRFYRRQDVEAFLRRSDASQLIKPVWIVNRSDKEGTVINAWRWLHDSSGVAYLEGGGSFSDKRLMLADVRRQVVEPLTTTAEGVRTFDVRDPENYVYTAVEKTEGDVVQQKAQREPQPATTIGTGHSLFELLLPDEIGKYWAPPANGLWAVIKGKRFEVKQDGVPLADSGDLALSPDATSLVTILPVREVPPSWETVYLPPYASMPFHIRRGEPAHQYVRIDLKTGSIQSLTDAPIGEDAGWGGFWSKCLGPSWSRDGLAVLLPGTFLNSPEHTPSTPCVAVVDFTSATRTCIATLKGRTDEKGYHFLLAAGAFFAQGSKDRVVATTYDGSYHNAEYRHTSGNTWQLVAEGNSQSIEGEAKDLQVLVKEGLDQPPLLVAQNNQTSRVIWDPNPQLDEVDLGRASIYKWKDKEGRMWVGGLYEPADYQRGQLYPLVIQTHGFHENLFRPSGLYPTGSAARSLAAAGIFVLQVDDQTNCSLQTPSEGSCPVAGYESAVNELVSEGKVDPQRIGIIGFSRSCYWVMEAVSASSVPFKAAMVTDGWMMTYFEYIATIDWQHNAVPQQFDTVIGASPFGENLRQWLKRSPGFNLDKITAPLLVVAGESRITLLTMWDVYAGLRYLHKPTDLIQLNTDEHVLTNPAVRLASQGGSVDWFRFWLKDEQDPDPGKAQQYARWQKLRSSP
jgi:dipeptidyl aminopeptidase/acylaminoacyl peptidase